MSHARGESDLVLGSERISPKTVELESGSPYLLKDVADRGGPVRPTAVKAQLFLPEGKPVGRPAVLVAHGLGGPEPVRELTYGAKLARAGYVGLVLDGFGSRGLGGVTDDLKAVWVTTWTLLADIFAGLRFLAAHPAVDPKAISVIGFSWGGMTTVLSAYEQVRRAFLGDEDLQFAGHAAYYGCSVPRLEDPRTTGAPVLMLLGEHDRNVSVERSRQICEDLRRGGSKVDLKVFDAYHQWDGKDFEMRHVPGSLADLCFTIGRDNEIRDEEAHIEMSGALSRALLLLKDVAWGGYDILRDEKLHRQTDEMLFDFLGRIAAREGLPGPDTGQVPLGQLGYPADERT